MYSIGDRVAHPMHGAGTISGITRQRMAGQERSYYVLTLLCGGLQLLVPCDAGEKVGLRPLSTGPELERLLQALPQLETKEQPNWNQRYRENMLRIKSGDLYEVARVVRGLSRREKRQQKTGSAEKSALPAIILIYSLFCPARREQTAKTPHSRRQRGNTEASPLPSPGPTRATRQTPPRSARRTAPPTAPPP